MRGLQYADTMWIGTRPGCSETESCVCVTDVMDIEENVWSPRYVL